jgi:alkanesulfonate monooxygenase SsuD/methylene tetrahydromethanopterin reductase-like flavin-dependent oxidoreductase (luciferase family)
VRFGAHLPVGVIEGEQHTLERFLTYVEAAAALGYSSLAIADHLTNAMIDPLTALAAVLPKTQRMELITSVALPVLRGPVPTAKALTALDILSGGRLTAGVGPGSSAADYLAVGIPYEERWKRMDECMQALRALLTPGAAPFTGEFYTTEGLDLLPPPPRRTGIPLWFGTWGSDAGLRRVVKHSDGWLASAFNIDPTRFGVAWDKIKRGLAEAGRDAEHFPNAVSTMFVYVTENKADAERALERAARALHRPIDSLRPLLAIGSPEHCAALFNAYAQAGAQQLFVNPMREPVEQLRLVMERVAPMVA